MMGDLFEEEKTKTWEGKYKDDAGGKGGMTSEGVCMCQGSMVPCNR